MFFNFIHWLTQKFIDTLFSYLTPQLEKLELSSSYIYAYAAVIAILLGLL